MSISEMFSKTVRAVSLDGLDGPLRLQKSQVGWNSGPSGPCNTSNGIPGQSTPGTLFEHAVSRCRPNAMPRVFWVIHNCIAHHPLLGVFGPRRGIVAFHDWTSVYMH